MDSYEKKNLIYRFVFILFATACVVAILSTTFTYKYLQKQNFLLTEKSESAKEANENIDAIGVTLKNFRRIIDNCFVGEIDENKILDETIKGYVKGLDDEYTEYMTKEEWEEYQMQALGNFVGIGIYMTTDKDGNVVVVSTIKDTPAEKAGLEQEDVIVEVEGESMIGLDISKVSSKIKGEPGTKVKLKVLRNKTEYVDFEVERKEIKVYHVESEMKDASIGYLQLITFDEGCSTEFKEQFEELKSKGAKKLIIDLRYNTGGLVNEALEIADMIVQKDKDLLITVDSENNEELTKSQNDPEIDMEIVVLVNEYSASASEILVGALKDNNEATIVGTKTFGKGVIQSVIPLSDGSILKITTNEYFTPNRTKIHKVGIDPDEVIDLDENIKDGENIKDIQLDKAIEILKSK